MNDSPRNIILVGFMGAGKTTVGQVLADSLGWNFLDLDRLIEERTGKTIPEIFSQEGESVFRDLETGILGEVAVCRFQVIATGGGIVGREKNWELMHALGAVVYLDVPWEVLVSRLRKQGGRPLATGEEGWEKVQALLESRRSLYRQAPLSVACARRSPEDIASEIMSRLNFAGHARSVQQSVNVGKDLENH